MDVSNVDDQSVGMGVVLAIFVFTFAFNIIGTVAFFIPGTIDVKEFRKYCVENKQATVVVINPEKAIEFKCGVKDEHK